MKDQLSTVKIDRVHISEEKTTKSGKKYFNAGISVDETWHNCMLWDEKDCDQLKSCEGQTLSVMFYKETYQEKEYNKFKLPSKLQIKVIELESRIEALEKSLKVPFEEVSEEAINSIPDEIPADPLSSGEFPEEEDVPF